MAPKTPQSMYTDAQKLEQSGDILGAIKIYKSFLSKHRSHPNAMKVRIRAAQLSVMQGKYLDAVKLIEHAGGAGQKSLLMMYTLAQANAYAGQLSEAHDALRVALGIDPDYPPAIARLATIMQYEGLKDEAMELIDQAYARGIDSWDIDHTLGELASKYGRVDEAAERIEKRLKDQSIKGAARIELEYMLCTLLEKQGNYQASWDAAMRANSQKGDGGMGGYAIKGAKKLKTNTGTKKYRERFEKTKALFTAEFLRTLEPRDDEPALRNQVLMISGLPRSGTTLLEQILSSHPQAESAGEAPNLIMIAQNAKMYPDPTERVMGRMTRKKRSKYGQQLLDELQERSGSDDYVVDKHPSNDEHIGFLAAIAPGAKMILTRRDPRDVALSCFVRNFALGHDWTNRFESIVDMMEMRLELHEHWLRVIPEGAPWLGLMVGDYQHIVQNPDEDARKLIEFCGLPWDDACLQFSKRKRIVPTLQPHQAAQGVYTGSLAKWANYAECMGGSLDRLNAICERFGFAV